jgi:small subunit ribosomal protein S24e
MNVDIVSTIDNKLLERREIRAEVSFDAATPKRAELKQAICGKVGANPELMVLREVSSKFGRKSVSVTAHLYPSKEVLMVTEPNHIKVREGLMAKPEKKKRAAAPAKKRT